MRRPNKAGSVYRLKGKRRRPWIARLTVDTNDEGRQVYQTIGYFKTKQEGLEALALHSVTPVSPKANITLKQLYGEWSERKYLTLSRATINNYKAAWHYITRYGDSVFKELRTAQWQAVIDEAGARQVSRSTLAKIRTLISLLYRYAAENDIVQKNYSEYITLPKAAKKGREIFSDAEIKILLAADNVWAGPILIMIYTGLRVTELLTLTRFGVDWDNEVIVGGIKTEAGKNRIVPLHPNIIPVIKKWYDKNSSFLICREDGSPLNANYYRTYKHYPTLKELGIRPLNPHACRHTFASLLARAGVNPVHIQQIMGHTDYAFTANLYTHPLISELKKSINTVC